jgi:hypothetical protein
MRKRRVIGKRGGRRHEDFACWSGCDFLPHMPPRRRQKALAIATTRDAKHVYGAMLALDVYSIDI